MAVELAELAAGLPMAASLALAGGIATLREGRRRDALNGAMHELRRPLQVLSLVLPDRLPDDAAVDSSLRLAADALDRLDRQINGAGLAKAPVRLCPREPLEEAVLRWGGRARSAGGSLVLRWRAGDACVEVDPEGFSQAVDNLINNAIEHGGREVAVEARTVGSELAVSVRDSGRRGEAGGRGGDREPRERRGRGGRRGNRWRGGRHGHGLRHVGRFAGAHGGSFGLRRGAGGAVATIRLPLAPRGSGR